MASVVTTTVATAAPLPQTSALADDPNQWPSDARDAHRRVLAQLESWCRAHDSSGVLNSWIAEEAVRQSW
ncbi:MAG: hypothetical protein V2I67_15820 [Thermoanaerobaculales bacterium]|jgi:hypothetical protein|nr:hypothetical protein [Thermoanaerobaculales bacterium]